MADKNIGVLPQADDLYDDSLFVVEHSGTAKQVSGRQVKDYAKEGVEAYVASAQEAAAEAASAAGTASAAIAVTDANKAAAQAAQGAAETAEQGAQDARAAIENMLVGAVTLATGTPATVTKELVDGVVKLVFGLPTGEKGGKGDTGASIQTVARTAGTGAPGTTDTYTITMTDGSTSTFQVYNGADGIGAGDMLVATYDPQKKNTDIFAYADSAASAAASGKQDKITGTQGQVVGFDADGNAAAQEAPEGGVVSFNGRSGPVVPTAGDYTAEMVGARPETWVPTAVQVGADPAGSAGTVQTALNTHIAKSAGRSMAGETVEPVQGTTAVAGEGAEVFNDYRTRTFTPDASILKVTGNVAGGIFSHAEGRGTTASGPSSHAEGWDSIASKTSAHAEGGGTKAQGDNSHSEGDHTIASGSASHTEGSKTQAEGSTAHAEGYGTTASGNNSHAENSANIAASINAHAEGSQTIAAGTDIVLKVSSYSASEKTFTFDSSYIGFSTAFSKLAAGVKLWVINNAYYDSANVYTVLTVDGNTKSVKVQETFPSSYSAGFAVVMVASTVRVSHAEGYRTISSGASSHAEGGNTTASSDNAHAEGNGTKAIGNVFPFPVVFV